MGRLVLTVVDTAAIQDYVFSSNNLKQNVGASELVHRATHDWVYEGLTEIGTTNIVLEKKENIVDIEFKDDLQIERDGLVSELVYAGGGNAVILFCSLEKAKEFTGRLTRRALLEAPELQVVVKHGEFDWQNDSLSKKVREVIGELNAKKADRPVSAPLLGLGVTADCQFTGLPAVDIDDKEKRRISAAVRAKLKAFDGAHGRLLNLLPLDNGKERYRIPKEFDDFGLARGRSSYIAVAHTDGNGMGRRVNTIAEQYPEPEDNRPYILAMRRFSNSVNEAGEKALKATVDCLKRSIVESNGAKKVAGIVELKEDYLPFRPIVFGGDDTTFVCEGRLGLTLAQKYLSFLSGQPLSDNGRPLSARAGVAVVKAHYPFARAYCLAEELAQSAKKYIKEMERESDESGVSAMDWHFAVGGLLRPLDLIRRQDYTVDSRTINMRPVRLGCVKGTDWRAWDFFAFMVSEFKKDQWSSRKNKLKDLQDALRRGKEAVEQLRLIYQLPLLPAVPGNDASAKNGYVDRRCICYDALEALEFFVPLEVANHADNVAEV